MNGADEEGRYAETYTAPSPAHAEDMALNGQEGDNVTIADGGLVIAAVLNKKGEVLA